MTYDAYYKKVGTRTIADFKSPKLIEDNMVIYPYDTAMVYGMYEKLTGELPIFTNTGRVNVLLINKYAEDIKGIRAKGVSLSSIVGSLKRKEKKFRFVLSDVLLKNASRTTLPICDISHIDLFFKYKDYKYSQIEEFFARMRTIVVNTISDKYNLIPISVPENIIPYNILDKVVNGENPYIYKHVRDLNSLWLVEIYKWMVGIPSRLDGIDSNTTFMFMHNGKVAYIKASVISALKNKVADKLASHISQVTNRRAYGLLCRFVIGFNNSALSAIDLRDINKDKLDEDEEVDKLVDTYNKTPIVKETTITKTTTIEAGINNLETKIETLNSTMDIFTSVKDKVVEEIKNSEYKDILYKPDTTDYSVDTPIETDVPLATIEKGIGNNKLSTFTQKYIDEVFDKDRDKVFASMLNAGVNITDIEHTTQKDIAYNNDIYNVALTTIDGVKHNISIRMPRPTDTGLIKYNGNEYILKMLKMDFPFKKIDYNRVSITSYYRKLFFMKGRTSLTNSGYSIAKILTKMNDNGIINLYVRGENNVMGKKLPLEYTLISRYTRSFNKDNVYFLFDYNGRDTINDKIKLSDIEKGKYILFASDEKVNYVVDKDSMVYEVVDGKYNKITNLLTFIGIDEKDIKPEYITIKLLGKDIPLILLYSYYYGIIETFKRFKIKHRMITRVNEANENELTIRFRDGILAITLDSYKDKLLFTGLTGIEKTLKAFDFMTLDGKEPLLDLFLALGYRKRHHVELAMLSSMMIDPMTERLLKSRKLPTTFVGLLDEVINALKDDYYIDQNDVSGIVYKGYERLNGMMYKILTNAISDYYSTSGTLRRKIEVNPYEIFKVLSSDGTFSLMDDTNPIIDGKLRTESTLVGLFGRGSESITNKDRATHPSAVGTESGDTKDSAMVGISTQLTMNPAIMSLNGDVTDIPIEKLKGDSFYSISALLSPGIDTDDDKRQLLSGVISSHLIPVDNSVVTPLTTDYAAVVAYTLPSKYAIHAKEEGVVTNINKSSITIKYKDGEKKYKLGAWYSRESNGITYKHETKTLLEKGMKVLKGYNITYDSAFFGRDTFNPYNVCYKHGALATTVFTNDADTFEDASGIDKEFSKGLTSVIAYTFDKILDKDMRLVKYKTIGEEVKYNDKLLTYSDVYEDDACMLDKECSSIIDELSLTSIVSSIKGKVTKIEVRYNCELDDLEDNLKEFVREVDKYNRKETGYIGRVDNTYSVRGKPLLDGSIYVKYYVEKTITTTLADKLVIANQLKTEPSSMFSNVYTESGEKVDLMYGSLSESARIVNSAALQGTTTRLVLKVEEDICSLWNS